MLLGALYDSLLKHASGLNDTRGIAIAINKQVNGWSHGC
jgi:hypothetical protein